MEMMIMIMMMMMMMMTVLDGFLDVFWLKTGCS